MTEGMRWPRKRLKYVAPLRRERVEGGGDRPYVGLEHIESGTGRLVASFGTENGAAPEGESLSNVFEPGDVLFGKLRPYLAKAWVAEFPGRCSTELLVMQPRDANAQFLRYVCLSRAFVDAVDASTFGSKMPRADWEFIGDMLVPLPPIREQGAIAAVLDGEMAQLDALVAAKEWLLALLAEKRRALVARAVTRGLDAGVAMRDSGVPWIGAVPAHWCVKQLRFACSAIRTGTTPTSDYPEGSGEETIDWFTPGDFQSSLTLRDSARKIPKSAITIGEAPQFPSGSVLVVGIGATLGKVGLTTGPASSNQQINALILTSDTDGLFLAYELSLMSDLMSAWASSATLPILNQQRMGDLPVVLPPIDEQKSIAMHVAEQTESIGALRTSTDRSLVTLRERRTALITAAVSGTFTTRRYEG